MTNQEFPERFLFYGSSGVGKSAAFQSIYREIVLPTGGHMYVVDTDSASARMFAHDDKSCLTYDPVHNFQTSGRLFNRYKKSVGSSDWIVVDMVTPLWQWAQDFYTMNAMKVKEDDLLFWSPPENYKPDWSVVNNYYSNLIKILLSCGANVIAIAEEDKISTEGSWADGKDIQNIFAPYGFKPRGQKRNPHLFHDIFWFSVIGQKNRKYVCTAVKEREGRKSGWDRHVMTDSTFATEFLLPAWNGDFDPASTSTPTPTPTSAGRKKRRRG